MHWLYNADIMVIHRKHSCMLPDDLMSSFVFGLPDVSRTRFCISPLMRSVSLRQHGDLYVWECSNHECNGKLRPLRVISQHVASLSAQLLLIIPPWTSGKHFFLSLNWELTVSTKGNLVLLSAWGWGAKWVLKIWYSGQLKVAGEESWSPWFPSAENLQLPFLLLLVSFLLTSHTALHTDFHFYIVYYLMVQMEHNAHMTYMKWWGSHCWERWTEEAFYHSYSES